MSDIKIDATIFCYDLSALYRFTRQVDRLTHFPEKAIRESCETVRIPEYTWDEVLYWAAEIISLKSQDHEGVSLASRIEGHSDIGRSVTAVCPYGNVTLVILHPLDEAQ